MPNAFLDMNDQEIVATSQLFGLLGDSTRVRILLLLCRGELNVSRLCAALGLPQPTVSHHLGLLRRGGFLTSRREGKSIYYAPDEKLRMIEDSELAINGAAGICARITC